MGNMAVASSEVLTVDGALGAPCASFSECASLHCADGYCCDAECDGECMTCAAASGATSDGACTLTPTVPCDDGTECTTADTCTATFECVGVEVVCLAGDDCDGLPYCDHATDQCVIPALPDGAPCRGGVCVAGDCYLSPSASSGPTSSSAGTSSGGGAGGNGGAGGQGMGGSVESGGSGGWSSEASAGGGDHPPGEASPTLSTSDSCDLRPGRSRRDQTSWHVAAALGIACLMRRRRSAAQNKTHCS